MTFMDNWNMFLMNDFLLGFMNYGNMSFLNQLFVYHRLDVFVKNVLMVLMNAVSVLFFDDVLMVLNHNFLLLLSNHRCFHVLLSYSLALMS